MSPPLVVVGAGALGQSFAGLLTAAGQPVTLLATPRSADRLRRTGRLVLCGEVALDVPISELRVVSESVDVPPGAAVLFTTKGQDLSSAIATLAPNNPVWTAGVQNGVQKDDLLAATFGAPQVLGAATIFGATRQENGSVRVGGRGMSYFGELDGRTSERAHAIAQIFNSAGIPAEARADMSSVLWSKACNATGVFGICVLARASNAHLFSAPDLMRAYLTLVRETAAVAAAYGARVGNYPGFPPIRTYAEGDEQQILANLSPPVQEAEPSYASMTHDLLADQPMEVEGVFGDIVAKADREGVNVPCLRFTRDVLRGLNAERHSSHPGP